MLIRSIGVLFALAANSAICSQERAAPAELEPLVLRALGDHDWEVRRSAVQLLAAFGTARHADEIAAVLDDGRREVRGAAWFAYLGLRPASLDRAIGSIADRRTWRDVDVLVRALQPWVEPRHAEALSTEFARAGSPDAQYGLLLLLARIGARMPDPAVDYVRLCETPGQILNASVLLPLLPDTPEQRERVTRWLGHQSSLVRHRCATWLLRHGVNGPEIERQVIRDYVDVEIYMAEAHRAAHSLGTSWEPTTRTAVLDAVGKARIVLVGDSHTSKDIADLTVDCCAASLAHGERGKVAFGYEAPVEISFALAKPKAEALGLVAVPLEPVDQLPSLRARDAAINAAIREWLDRSPDHKMVALYGQAHLLGAGHVDVPGAVRVLTSRPAANGLLPHLRAEALATGVLAADEERWFVHPTRRDTFFVLCADHTWPAEENAAFTAWLAARLR